MGVLEKYAPVEGGSVLGKYKAEEFRPGEDWTVPIQDEHPELAATTRLKLMSLADAGPKTMLLNLEKEGFEARHRGGMDFAIRKPGEKDWYVVDPAGFEPIDDTLEFLGSAGPAMLGMFGGGTLGSLVGGTTLGPAGAIGGGVTGAGLGGAAAERAKQGLGRLAGIEYDPEEVGEKVVTEGATSAAAQALAPGLAILGGVGKEGVKRAIPAAGRIAGKAAARIPTPVIEGLQKVRGGTAAALEKAGTVAGLPGRTYDVVAKKMREVATPGLRDSGGGALIGPFGTMGLAYGAGVGPQVTAGLLTAFGSKIAERGLKSIASTIMGNPRVLLAHANKAKGAIAAKLRKPLEILQKRGREAYIAAVYTALHDPEVREYLQSQEKKK